MTRYLSINEADSMASSELLPAIENVRATVKPVPSGLPSVDAAKDRWIAFDPALASGRNALLIFEAWNLLIIGVSLDGFNHIPRLVSSPWWMFWGLLTAAVGTVGVTGYSVSAWTRG